MCVTNMYEQISVLPKLTALKNKKQGLLFYVNVHIYHLYLFNQNQNFNQATFLSHKLQPELMHPGWINQTQRIFHTQDQFVQD